MQGKLRTFHRIITFFMELSPFDAANNGTGVFFARPSEKSEFCAFEQIFRGAAGGFDREVKTISAFGFRVSGHFAVISRNKTERVRYVAFRFVRLDPAIKDIKTGLAAHGANVNYRFGVLAVAQYRREQVFERVHLGVR